jgi:hypothetical protein
MGLLAMVAAILTSVLYAAQLFEFRGYQWADITCQVASGACDLPQSLLLFATGALIPIAVVLKNL